MPPCPKDLCVLPRLIPTATTTGGGIRIRPILQMRKLRPGEAKAIARCHPAGKGLGWTLVLQILRQDRLHEAQRSRISSCSFWGVGFMVMAAGGTRAQRAQRLIPGWRRSWQELPLLSHVQQEALPGYGEWQPLWDPQGFPGRWGERYIRFGCPGVPLGSATWGGGSGVSGC